MRIGQENQAAISTWKQSTGRKPDRNHHKTEIDSDRQSSEKSSNELSCQGGDNTCRGERAHGVMRLLAEGHFKGVADLRLRINFHEQLAARTQQEVSAATRDGISDITGEVQNMVDDFAAGLELSEEQTETLAGYMEQFGNTGISTDQDPITDLQARFDSLVSALKSLFLPNQTQVEPGNEILEEAAADDLLDTPTQTVVESDPEQSIAVGSDEAAGVLAESISLLGSTDDSAELMDSDEETAGGLGGAASASETGDQDVISGDDAGAGSSESQASLFLADLRLKFEEALTSLENTLSEIERSTEPASPRGKGRAYEKFLAIYHELTNPEPEVPIESEQEGLEAMA